MSRMKNPMVRPIGMATDAALFDGCGRSGIFLVFYSEPLSGASQKCSGMVFPGTFELPPLFAGTCDVMRVTLSFFDRLGYEHGRS
jgi:hypothetical protein